MRARPISFMFLLAAIALLFGLLTLQQPVAAQTLGTNWVGAFFLGSAIGSNPVASAQNIPYPNGLSFNWGNGFPLQSDNVTPVPGVTTEPYSVRFTSSQNITTAGTYRFTVRVNDGIRVTINNTLYLDRFTSVTDGQYAEYTFDAPLFVGNNAMVVDYVDFAGSALLQFQWGQLSGGIGTPTFPTSTAQPAATGTVVRVRGLAVRTGPYLGASMVAVARPNNAYPIIAKNFNEGLFPWYKIKIGDSEGWASGRYLQASGNLDVIPVQNTVFEELGANNIGRVPPALNVIGTTRSVMNLRVRPSERTQLLGQIPWGDQVTVYGRTVQGGLNHWLFVRYKDSFGWIFAPYIKLDGIVDAIPVY